MPDELRYGCGPVAIEEVVREVGEGACCVVVVQGFSDDFPCGGGVTAADSLRAVGEAVVSRVALFPSLWVGVAIAAHRDRAVRVALGGVASVVACLTRERVEVPIAALGDGAVCIAGFGLSRVVACLAGGGVEESVAALGGEQSASQASDSPLSSQISPAVRFRSPSPHSVGEQSVS